MSAAIGFSVSKFWLRAMNVMGCFDRWLLIYKQKSVFYCIPSVICHLLSEGPAAWEEESEWSFAINKATCVSCTQCSVMTRWRDDGEKSTYTYSASTILSFPRICTLTPHNVAGNKRASHHLLLSIIATLISSTWLRSLVAVLLFRDDAMTERHQQCFYYFVISTHLYMDFGQSLNGLLSTCALSLWKELRFVEVTCL
jgi:hypothetical protein